MKAVVRNPELRNEFKSGICFILCPIEGVRLTVPGKCMCRSAKRITAIAAEAMPVSTGKTQLFLHGFASNYLLLIVPAKSEWIVRIPAFIADLRNAFEKLC